MAGAGDHDAVQKYEHFINEVLKADLRHVLDLRDKIISSIAEYTQLKDSLTTLNNRKLTTQVDLGRNFYVQAEVEKLSHIHVDLGYGGLHVQMTPEEASGFVDKKLKMLQERSARLTEEAARIKSHIRVALEMLRSLQQIDPTDYSKSRDLPL